MAKTKVLNPQIDDVAKTDPKAEAERKVANARIHVERARVKLDGAEKALEIAMKKANR